MSFLLSRGDQNSIESSMTISDSATANSVVNLEQLLKITSVPIFCIDIYGIIVTSNAEFAAVLGCNREDLLGKNLAKVTFTRSLSVCKLVLNLVGFRILLHLSIDSPLRNTLSEPAKESILTAYSSCLLQNNEDQSR
jgi:hypothetical protein